MEGYATPVKMMMQAEEVNNDRVLHVRIQRGDRGSGPPPPLKNHKLIGFPSNTGPDPLKNHKATKPAVYVGPSSARQQNAN